jgi:transposase
MHSVDLRKKALKYKETHSEAETSEIFGVSESAIRQWEKMKKEQGNAGPKELKRNEAQQPRAEKRA